MSLATGTHSKTLSARNLALKDMAKRDREQHSAAIKSLLAAVMIADKKLHKSELEKISTAIAALDPLEDNANAKIRHWLKDNIAEINSAVNGPNKMRWLALQFLKLRGYQDKEAALDHLWRVAIADGELHDDEAEIIDRALWLWRQ